MYCDPPWWQSEIDAWALEHGEKVVLEFATYRPVQMHAALQRFVTDLTTGSLTHDDCKSTALHIANARKAARPGDRYILTKPAGAYHQKIDAAVTSVLAHEAAADARAAGWGNAAESYAYVF
jgi:phage terminase large subunit-like protein